MDNSMPRILAVFFLLLVSNLLLIACSDSSGSSDEAPRLIHTSPIDKARVSGPSITFEWEDVSDESGYILEISNTSSFDGELLFSDNQIPKDSEAYTLYVPFLELQELYYWRVVAKKSSTQQTVDENIQEFLFVYSTGIHFQNVSNEYGINHMSPSFGLSWGDFNGDGWLDLWSGNHYAHPSLYINNEGKGFTDIGAAWNGSIADAHGAAWIDLNNDGNEELLQLSGGGVANRVIVNENGMMVDKAIEYGLDIPGPRGRTPLWLDWNNDKLDDVVLTRIQNSQTHPLILRNENRSFADYTSALNVTMADSNYAQVADLNGDKKLDLIFHNRVNFPSSVYDISTEPFQDISSQLTIPIDTNYATYDSVIADLDNNLRNDILVVKRRFDIELFQRSERQLDAKIIQTASYPVRKYYFTTTDSITVSAYFFNNNFTPTDQIYIGSARLTSDQFTNTVDIDPIFKKVEIILNPSDSRVSGHVDSEAILQDVGNNVANSEGLFIGFNAAQNEWQIISSLPNQTVNIVIESAQDITSTSTGPYWSGIPAMAYAKLYMQSNGNNFVDMTVSNGLDMPSSCGAAIGADFDNDMDVDLYFVCTNGVSNIDNRLYENDGTGTFSEVLLAAGAKGSDIGQGENVAYADYDKDGFIDLFVVNGESLAPFHNGPHQLFRNLPNTNHWIEIELENRFSANKGLGATVIVEAGGIAQMREQNGGYHRYSQNSQIIHFGLGQNTIIDKITLYWPSGIVQTLTDVSVDQILKVTEIGETGCSDNIDNNNNQAVDFPDDTSCSSWQDEE